MSLSYFTIPQSIPTKIDEDDKKCDEELKKLSHMLTNRANFPGQYLDAEMFYCSRSKLQKYVDKVVPHLKEIKYAEVFKVPCVIDPHHNLEKAQRITNILSENRSPENWIHFEFNKKLQKKNPTNVLINSNV